MAHLPKATTLDSPSNDYHILPVTQKQLQYALAIAEKSSVDLPSEARADRRAMSAWIEAHRPRRVPSRFDNYPSSKQVAFAERIARKKRREVPRECFRDRMMMSRWIDSNL